MIDENNTKLIPLTQGKFAIVDSEDFDRINKNKWYFHYGYAIRNISLDRCAHCNVIKRKTIYMHKEIIGKIDSNLDGDHINRNKLDNRKINLRLVTRSQNLYNSKRKNKIYSKYKGVTRPSKGKKFCVQINFKGKTIYVGAFDKEIDAALAYNKKAIELFGEFACLNQID